MVFLVTVLDGLNGSGSKPAKVSMPSWEFIEMVSTKMYVSSEKHICWIFKRG
jgi:hypothetical protein